MTLQLQRRDGVLEGMTERQEEQDLEMEVDQCWRIVNQEGTAM